MTSFEDLDVLAGAVPFTVVTDLRTIDMVVGTLSLHRDRLPGLLGDLAARARTASIEASSAIDGVVVDNRRRASEIVAGRDENLRDRDEQELAGYRAAYDHLAREPWRPLDVDLVLHLHRLLFAHTTQPGGRLREVETRVVGRPVAGTRVKRFTPVPVAAVPDHLERLVARHGSAQDAERHHPVLLVGLFALDLLAIHPFPDGNGRVARVLTTALLQDAGYDVTRYVSLEAALAASPEAYATALLDSTHDWHEARHDPWPWLGHLVRTLADASSRLAALTSTARGGGSKQDRVREHVLHHARRTFRISEVRTALPGVSDQTIRLVLAQLKAEGRIEVDGVGRSASWTVPT